MINDKNNCLKIIEAILFANSDLVDEKDLTKNIPRNFDLKKAPSIEVICHDLNDDDPSNDIYVQGQ